MTYVPNVLLVWMDANDWLSRLAAAEDTYLDDHKLGSAAWRGADHSSFVGGKGWRGVLEGNGSSDDGSEA